MRTWKLVSGILSIIFCLAVLIQSCAAGMGNILQENGEVGGSAGFIVAIMFLAGGIVSIASRNSVGKGGNIAIIVLYGLGALIGFLLAGSFSNLIFWAFWCLICAVLAIVAIIKGNNEEFEEDEE